MAADPLDLFLPPVAAWFRGRFGAPTPPQRIGWPEIVAGRNTLLAAPTGSGKTLAAFLACLDQLWRNPRPSGVRGVRVLYISPLKALGNDIARNLEQPLSEILETAEAIGYELAPLTQATRSGDTPAAERQRITRTPPDILITTPESLHLMLTSRAREILRDVRYVVVDEIHAVCANKRGVFLSILLERLQALQRSSFARIGLSATQRPLEEVARFLGGQQKTSGAGPSAVFQPRAVTILDAGQRKDLDLQVSLPGGIVPLGGSIWPSIEARLVEDIRAHRSTIVFTNNRRSAERLAGAINDRASDLVTYELSEFEHDGNSHEPPEPIARPHHGSLSLEARQLTENALKIGDLQCVVATASLELGIDMGAVDLVCQVESAGGVARALQRVGRAGHVVGQVSRGRIYAKTCADLLEAAALARAMLRGEVELLRTPTNCLDILAQQVVACAAAGPINALDVFDLMRQSYSFRSLSAAAFEDVLAMVSGRWGLESFRDLSPRISWDRVHNTLNPLPGTAQLALVGGGSIPDTGRYPLYLGDGGPRLGELDEEFVLERRAGDTFRLGHGTWRIESIDPHRVIVSPAAGQSALVPFWRGEGAGRTAELGEAVGQLARELTERLERREDVVQWLRDECRLDEPAAQLLTRFVQRQRAAAGAVPDDQTLILEAFTDQSGETGLALLSPLGAQVNHALRIILRARLRERLGIAAATLHGDDGVVARLPNMRDVPLDVLDDIDADEAERLLRDELGDSALFGLRFRQNAGRALLMPRPDPGRRTPLWLQRLRARDLLQVVRQRNDHPIVAETYRECLDDDLQRHRVRALFDALQAGRTRLVKRQGERPSPMLSELLFIFTLRYLYEWDEPQHTERPRAGVSGELLESLLADNPNSAIDLDPAAVARLDQRLRRIGTPPRTSDEMFERLRRLGDMTPLELPAPMQQFVVELAAAGRATRINLPGTSEPERWITTEDLPLYHSAFPEPDKAEGDLAAQTTILRRYCATHALVGLDEIRARYPLDPAAARDLVQAVVDAGDLVPVGSSANGDASQHWADQRNLLDARRLTIALRRREAVAVPPEVFCDFVVRRQFAHPETKLEGEANLPLVLERLEGLTASPAAWRDSILRTRMNNFRPAWLDALLTSGSWIACAPGASSGRELEIAIVGREFPGFSRAESETPISAASEAIWAFLQSRGLCHVDEISRGTGIAPSGVRAALGPLLKAGRVVADRWTAYEAPSPKPNTVAAPAANQRGLRRPRGRASLAPLERWAANPIDALDSRTADAASAAVLDWAGLLLDRYGVVSRDVAALEPCAPAWRDLFEVLNRAELRGEVRRGYFVEGLSGVQFALGETADALAQHAARFSQSSHESGDVPALIAANDPANLYGGGAPFDIPLLNGGEARLPRVPSNAIVMIRGRPVLILEGHGRRLTGLPSASETELAAASTKIAEMPLPVRRILKVETYNSAPVLRTPAAAWLAACGFVRDHVGMARYPGF